MKATKAQLDMQAEYIKSLSAFARWMNRPLARVQVYTYRTARKIFGDSGVSMRFRCKPGYRGNLEKRQRKIVADSMRNLRAWDCVVLPQYKEALAEYTPEQIKGITNHDPVQSWKA